MFISLCENKTAFLIDAGYIFWLECRSSNYERIAWKKRNVIIAIEHERYEFRLGLDIYVHGIEVDVNKLFSDMGLPYKCSYEYFGAGLEKGVTYISEALEKLINDIYWMDEEGLIAKLEDTLLPPPPPLQVYELEHADQAYLSGDFRWAARFYKQYENFMTDLQRRRYKRSLIKIQEQEAEYGKP